MTPRNHYALHYFLIGAFFAMGIVMGHFFHHGMTVKEYERAREEMIVMDLECADYAEALEKTILYGNRFGKEPN